MVKTDEQTQLLREIRDLLREEQSMRITERKLAEDDKKAKNLMVVLKMIFNLLIGAFTIGAFYYFYHTVYGSGLLGN